MKTLNMTVTDKLLVRDETDEVIVCGNGDYQIQFAFDAEWNAFSKKTARFTWNGRHEDVEFNGNTCVIPMLINTGVVTVGVYAGEGGVDNKPLATTKVPVYCVEGSRCGDSSPNPNTGENYTNQARGYAANAAKSAEAAAASAEEAKEAAENAGGGSGGLSEVGKFAFELCNVNQMDYDTFGDAGIYITIDGELWKHGNLGDSGFPIESVNDVARNSKFVKVEIDNYMSSTYDTPITGIGAGSELLAAYININPDWGGFTACEAFWEFIEENYINWWDGFKLTFTFYA